MPLLLTSSSPALPLPAPSRARFRVAASAEVGATGRAAPATNPAKDFPPFLPKAVERIRDRAAVRLARRIERVPVQTGFSKNPIQSSCVRPLKQQQQQSGDPVVLLHGFDSSCLEWRYTYPLLEEAGLEAWAVDILGWGFSDLETRPPCDIASKREHLYQFWRTYIKRPMVLVGPSLGAAVAIDFAVNYPEAVSKLIFIGASVYAEGTKDMTRVPKFVPYAGIGRLHCLLPWWEDATVNFMITGGYNVLNQIKQVKQKCLVLWGEDDGIISNKQAYRLQQELPSAILRQVGQCGHIPHVEKPREAAKHLIDFLGSDSTEKADQASSLSSNLVPMLSAQ
ncbi:alpha/beta hydrolase domain-containing protein VTE7 isoform X2 [Lolium perenne]|uniref:alpha/beta hydrolase domain-containing protein VTE7 isoform X2 n=1 Tax=Lolium perenne TaxID=4522 RepID=UPI0021F5C931|nr:uncharacterized protein LOC127332735 isoform X2 [Lolium perenne]